MCNLGCATWGAAGSTWNRRAHGGLVTSNWSWPTLLARHSMAFDSGTWCLIISDQSKLLGRLLTFWFGPVFGGGGGFCCCFWWWWWWWWRWRWRWWWWWWWCVFLFCFLLPCMSLGLRSLWSGKGDAACSWWVGWKPRMLSWKDICVEQSLGPAEPGFCTVLWSGGQKKQVSKM